MFPDGWPGRSLLLLRLVAGTLLIHDGVAALLRGPQLKTLIPESVALLAGALFLAGLWTPVAGALVVIVESWFAFAGTIQLENAILLAALGAALAALGPGYRSVDARLFGRKRFDIGDR
jgi:putative oxidoreductase